VILDKPYGLWTRLVSETVELEQPGLERQVRLLSNMVAVCLPLVLFGGAVSTLIPWARPATSRTLFFTSVILVLVFMLNRRGRHAAAVWLTIAVSALSTFLISFNIAQETGSVLYFTLLFTPLLFACFFLSERIVTLLFALFIASVAAVPLILPTVNPVELAFGPLFFLLINGGLKVLFVRHRRELEQDRRQELATREALGRALLETSYEGIGIVSGGKIVDANANLAHLFGYTTEEIIGQPLASLIPEDFSPQVVDGSAPLREQPRRIALKNRSGKNLIVEAISRQQSQHNKPMQVIALRDVTAQVQAEEERDRNAYLYRTLFEGAYDAIFLVDFDGQLIAANQKAVQMLGYSLQEMLGRSVIDGVLASTGRPLKELAEELSTGGSPLPVEMSLRRQDGTHVPVKVSLALVRAGNDQPLCIQALARDITGDKEAEARIQRQIAQLRALREIDRMITSSRDLHATLDVLIEQTAGRLGVDAAAVLLLNPYLYQLEAVSQWGLKSWTGGQSIMLRDEPLAAQAIETGHLVRIPDLDEADRTSLRLKGLADDGFLGGFAVPLTAKGQVKGVLEVFMRRPFDPQAEWLEFLEALGGQAAIAVENAELFTNLQRSNLNLVRSYDATLEGWAKALELRDKETEGHSQRVTDMTVRLGKALGLNGDELVHLRRGALLHDIGKMGIPDSILLKNGPLNEEEWEVMKQHPVYAYQMLASIPFLAPALEIPYCHHEKWDGSGYPRGLQGQEIPLAARIFAVVDVWDALSSDRPYRPRWSDEEVLAYLREQSGKHFDPQVVEAFLQLLFEQQPETRA